MNGENDRHGRNGTGPSADPYREEMWDAISSAWDTRAAAHRRSRGLRVRTYAGLGIAATLVAGVLIGRWSVQTDLAVEANVAATGYELSLPHRVALGEHLRDTETLLVLFQAAERSELDFSVRARELAAATRLLLASGAARDAELETMLQDLESLLLQIAHVAAGADATEFEITQAGITQTDALARLRLMRLQDPQLIRNPI